MLSFSKNWMLSFNKKIDVKFRLKIDMDKFVSNLKWSIFVGS